MLGCVSFFLLFFFACHQRQRGKQKFDCIVADFFWVLAVRVAAMTPILVRGSRAPNATRNRGLQVAKVADSRRRGTPTFGGSCLVASEDGPDFRGFTHRQLCPFPEKGVVFPPSSLAARRV